jgi:hypothetical protein
MPRKKKQSNLPSLGYPDGGNRYIGKTKENSDVWCEFCEAVSCPCVQPARTAEELKSKLVQRIHDAKLNMSLNKDRGRWSGVEEKVVEWERRLAELQ